MALSKDALRHEQKSKPKLTLKADPPVKKGDKRLVFDAQIWSLIGGASAKDQQQFWKPATIIELSTIGTAEIATVRFHHDKRISQGHYTYNMQCL